LPYAARQNRCSAAFATSKPEERGVMCASRKPPDSQFDVRPACCLPVQTLRSPPRPQPP